MTDSEDHPDFLRIEKHFPDGADLTLQVLKGHLLVEELLRDIFELLLAHPEAMQGSRGTRLECHQIICLVQAMTKHSSSEPWFWDAAKRLNGIRNDLAHSLEPKSLDEKVASLITFVTHDNPVVKSILDSLATPQGMEFKAVILAMCGSLSTLKEIVSHERGGAA